MVAGGCHTIEGESYERLCLAPSCGTRIDWVIVGGESGARHRLMDLEWVRSIREQCKAAGVAYFGKQDHGSRPEVPLPGELGDREWPEVR